MTKNRVIYSLACLIFVASTAVTASDWSPQNTLRLQIAFGAGGSTDVIGRVLVDQMREQSGWKIIAENVEGGGGVAMLTGIAKRPANNDVIGLAVNVPILINLAQRSDELEFGIDDFSYVGTVSTAQLALVARADAPFDDLEGLVRQATEEPGLAVGFGAPPQRFLMDAVARDSGAQFGMVSTEGGAETIRLLLGGQVMVGFLSGEHLPYLESGDLKVVGSANRDPLSYAPEAQTFSDIGHDFHVVDPYLFLAMAADSDAGAIEAISDVVEEALKTAEMVEIVQNIHHSKPVNLGADGTRQMLAEGLDTFRQIFAK